MSELEGPKFLGFDGDHEVIYAKVQRQQLRGLPESEFQDLSEDDLQAAANVANQLAQGPALPISQGQPIEVAELVAQAASASTPGEEPRAEATPRLPVWALQHQPQAEVQPAPQPQQLAAPQPQQPAEPQPQQPAEPQPSPEQQLQKLPPRE